MPRKKIVKNKDKFKLRYQDDMSPEQLAELRTAFEMFDKDHSGTISNEELTTAMRILGGNPTDEEIACLMDSMDQDKNNSIDFEEFCKLMKQHLKDPEEEENALREAFAVFDRNGDGFVSTDEIRAVMKSIGKTLTDREMSDIMGKADDNGDGILDYEEFVKVMTGGKL